MTLILLLIYLLTDFRYKLRECIYHKYLQYYSDNEGSIEKIRWNMDFIKST